MDDSLVKRALKEHESRIVLLANKVKWLESQVRGLEHLYARTNRLEKERESLRVEQDGRVKRLLEERERLERTAGVG